MQYFVLTRHQKVGLKVGEAMIHSTIRTGNLAVVLSACFALTVWSSISLSASPGIASDRAIQIAVLVQHSDGRPIGGLTPEDFAVSLQGRTIPATLSRPVMGNKAPTGDFLPTRMLVILPRAAVGSADMPSDLMTALGPVWQRGWQVAIAQDKGKTTGFTTSALQLKQMWDTPPGPQVSAEAMVASLKSFGGRRVVLYTTDIQNERKMPPERLIQAASDSMAQMLVVNGGVLFSKPDMPALPGSGGWSSGRNPQGPKAEESQPGTVPGADLSRQRKGQFLFGPGPYRGLYQEADAHHAVQDALHDAVGYYVLQIAYPPAGLAPSGANVSLTLNLKNASKLLISAKAYNGDKVLELAVTTK
jgi:hypothetical protein